MRSFFRILSVCIIAYTKSFGQMINNKSYQVRIEFKKAVSANIFLLPDASTAITKMTYFDGLGRPIQVNSIKSSGENKDLIKHIEYTVNGDLTKEYLSVPTLHSQGMFVEEAGALTTAFYNTQAYNNTANPYVEKVLEKSPERKILAQGFPGNEWNAEEVDNHAVKFEYKTNSLSDSVKKYQVETIYDSWLKKYTPSIFVVGVYQPNELYKTITKNENWSYGKEHTIEEYKNKLGQVVLTRRYDKGEAHDTYNVYDVYGNLTYVIPPKANGNIDSDNLEQLCYQYVYDYKNRLVEKKIPQKGWEYYIYDKEDRLVLKGPVYDPFGEGTKGWMVNKYDAFGRIVYTGFYASNVFSSEERKNLSEQSFVVESKSPVDVTIDGLAVRYTNNSFPTTINILTVHYYDNYNYPAAPTSFSAIEEQTVNQDIKGYPTGVWTRVLTSSSELVGELTHYLYDNKYRLIRKHQTNSLGGYTQTDHKLNFSGLPIKTEKQQKYAANGNVLKLTTNYEYDINNRILSQKQQINAGAVEHLFLNTYDELGRIKTKHTGGISANLQKVDYTYNIRGWLSGINTEEATPFVSDLYKQKIYYHEENAGINTPMYDGSISYIETRTLVDNKQRGYRYIYDELNRLEKADFFEGQDPINKNSYKEYLTYDKNGNIQTLSRTGALISHQPVEIDELVYVYQGNQVQSITDATANSEGFSDGNTQGEDYVYDEFGNLVQDKNKNISSIGYNHLNLPVRILFSDASSIHYVYDAMGGRKSKKVQPASGAITTADYQDIFQYENGVLQFFAQPEGYVKPHNEGYLYVYQYKDHLGNIRLSYADIDGNGSIDPASEILEENNYYPFGLQHQGYNELAGNPAYKYKYNGKELQEIGMYDYGARFYMPDIGRWLGVDPLAEKYPSISPYTYVANNPIGNIDPDGRQIVGVTKKDAQNFKADVHKVLADEKFAGVRALIDVKGSTFKSIDSKALSTALDGVSLSADEKAYIDMVTNTINSKDVHKIEYLSGDFTSSEGATAFKNHMNKVQAGRGDMMLTPEGKLSAGIIDNFGSGLNVPTTNGSHSFIGSGVTGDERAVTSGHELFGHGIPSAKKFGPKANNANAIRTDNLIRRMLGMPERDGSDHGGFKEGHITEPKKLPITE